MSICRSLACNSAYPSEDAFLGFGTIDYSADDKKNVEYMGVSVYERSEGKLQSKFSLQVVVQDDLVNETKTFLVLPPAAVTASAAALPLSPA
jgi:hypothetical protein